MRARWEAWKTRNAWWWDFTTTPALLIGLALLFMFKWIYRLKRAASRDL